MTDKIYITENDIEIIDYITDAGIKHNDDNTSRVFTFLLEDNYHLVLFFASLGDKGFLMFKIDSFRDNTAELNNLKIILQNLLEDDTNVALLKEAISQVEIMVTSGFAIEAIKKGIREKH